METYDCADLTIGFLTAGAQGRGDSILFGLTTAYTPRRLRSSSACSCAARTLSITLRALIAYIAPQASQRRRGDDSIVATLTAVFCPQVGQGIFTKSDGSMLWGIAAD